MAVNIGPRIGIEGEKEYRAQLNNIIQSQKTLAAEMKVVASEFEQAEAYQERLTRRTDIYNRMAAEQARHLDMLQSKLKAATEKWGESDARTQKWKEAIAHSRLKLNELNKSLEKTKKELAGINFEKAVKNLDKFGSSINRAAEQSRALSAASAVAIVAMTKQASDYTENINKTKEAFKGASAEVIKFSETALNNFGVDKSQALEMSSLFGDMATSMGLVTDEAAKMSTALVGLGGDLSSFKNMSINEVTTALNGIFTGETESLKRLGVVMTETNLKAYALSKGMEKQYKDMSQAEKVTLRYNYVLEMTKNAQGDFARTREEAANSTRLLKGQIKELSIELGSSLLPTVKDLLAEAVKLAQNFNKLDEDTKKTIANILLFTSAIYPLTKGIAGVTSGASAAAKGLDALSAAMNVTKGNAIMAAGKLGLLVAAIGTVLYAMQKYADFKLENHETMRMLQERAEGFERLKDSIEETGQTIQAQKEWINGDRWAGNSGNLEKLAQRYVELNEKTKLTRQEAAEMKSIAGQLAGAMPELSGNIDSVTGAYKGQIGAVALLIEKTKELARVTALSNQYTAAELELNKTKVNYDLAVKDFNQLMSEKNNLRKQLFDKAYSEWQGINKRYNPNIGQNIHDPMQMDSSRQEEWLKNQISGYKASRVLNAADVKAYLELEKKLKESGDRLNQSHGFKKQAGENLNYFNNELSKTRNNIQKLEAELIGLNEVSRIGGGGSSVRNRGGSGGSYQRKDPDQGIIELAKKRIELLKASNAINLKQEVDYWKGVLKVVKKGSEEYEEVQHNILKARDSYNNAKAKSDKKYIDTLKGHQKELKSRIKENLKAYKDALSEQKETFKNQFKLFDKHERGERKTPWELTQNLSSQVQGFKSWQTDLEKIKNRGVSDEMLDEIKKMGVGAAEAIKAMTEMSDSELLNYITVWQEFNQSMAEVAEKELEPLKAATEEANQELLAGMDKGIKQANRTYKKGLKALGTSGAAAAKRAGKLTAQALLEGLKSQDEALKAYMQQMQDTIATALNINITAKPEARKKIKKKADGGYVGTGELFIAGERGAELVGSLNGHTAVANGSQMGYALVKAIEPHISKLLNYNNSYSGAQAVTLYNTTITNIDGKTIDKVVTRRVISNATRLSTAYSGIKGS